MIVRLEQATNSVGGGCGRGLRAVDSAGHLSFSSGNYVVQGNTGSVNEKMQPFGDWGVTRIRRPCRVTSSLHMYKPSPRPFRPPWASDPLVEAFKNSVNGSQALSRQSPAADKNEKSVWYGIRNAFELPFNSEHF
jgi:hypothetical protein